MDGRPAATDRAIKAAELASGLGGIALGAGLALVLPEWLRSYAAPLLFGGLAAHGLGMTLKHRWESRRGPLLAWDRGLFWLCWACLASVAIWMTAGLIVAPR